LTLKPSSLSEFGHHGFVSFLLALDEFPIMTCDNAVTKPHIGRVLTFSQQLKFRGAFSVEPHAHKTVQYGHGRSRQSADKYENKFYVKNHQSALALPAFFHMYPHNQRLIGFKTKEREAEEDSAAKSFTGRQLLHRGDDFAL
jgi:hypothetical protein